MSDIVKQDGVILRKIPYGEADEIVTVLFQDGGVRRLFAAGSRKSRKRYAGLVDAFAHLRLEYRESAVGSLWRLRGVDEPERPVARRRVGETDLSAYAFFNYLAELICEFVLEEERTPSLFKLWDAAETRVAERGFSEVLAVRILARALAIFGYALSFENCSVCGAVLAGDEKGFFAPDAGGLVCRPCASKRGLHAGYAISSELLASLKAGATDASAASSRDEAAQILSGLIAYVRTLLQKRTRAEEFLLQLILPA